ncbi:transposase [Mangrovibacterium lignilyticum]|uniref:transposase n=1 Tax=Mangrovibacterium lignilyticum TaxID=2668052 RepID=UPI003742148F
MQYIAASVHMNASEILNFFDNRNTNASMESLNTKSEDFRASQRGVNDNTFSYIG